MANGCSSNVLLVKLDGTTGDLLWVTYMGGKAPDSGTSVAVGSDGTVYVAGLTASSDFPVTDDALIPKATLPQGFLTRFSPDGKSLISSTYFNGTPQSMTLDAAGAVFVTGTTTDTYPGTPGAYQPSTGYVNLMRSSDGGDTWRNLDLPSYIWWLEPHPSTAGKLYAATSTGLFQSEDGGLTWNNPEGPFQSVVVTQVRIDPTDGQKIYVIAKTNPTSFGLWISSNGGSTWENVQPSFLPGTLTINRTHLSTLYFSSGTTVISSADGGKAWSQILLPFLNGLTADVLNGDVIYLGYTNSTNLLRSSDAGKNWNTVTDPCRCASNIRSTPLFASGSNLFHSSPAFTVSVAGNFYMGMRRSTSGDLPSVFDMPGVPANTVVGDPTNPSRLFASGGAGLYISQDMGNTWLAVRANMDNSHVTQIAVGAKGDLFAVAALQPGAFVAKLTTDLSQVSYFTAYGDSGGVTPAAITVDSNGRAIIAGTTSARNMPVSDGQAGLAGFEDGFVARFSPDGAQLDFARLVGGTLRDTITGLAVAPNGDIYIAGRTNSADYPVTANAFQSKNKASQFGGFISVLGGDGNLKYSTYLSGSSQDMFGPICLAGDKLYLGGFIASTDFPGLLAPPDNNGNVTALVQFDLRAAGVP